MTSVEFLLWVRGPAFEVAISIFIIGMLIRLLEILLLGRKADLAAPRRSGVGDGFRAVVSRSIPNPVTWKSNPVTLIAGYIFHIGLLVALFFLAPHIELFESVLGFAWPALPTPLVDFVTALSILALFALLWHRVTNPVKRMISTPEDYVVWLVTLLPLLTGYMAYHHLFFGYNWLLGAHILSAELLLVVFPFTKLTHAFTLFIARWYTGMMAGRRGVEL